MLLGTFAGPVGHRRGQRWGWQLGGLTSQWVLCGPLYLESEMGDLRSAAYQLCGFRKIA